jgi:Bacterial aa3 type cytochrome c oxidase subunit IV
MADHGEVEYATAEGNDYPAHEQTYGNFITMVKVIGTIVVIIVIGLAYFLG